MMTATFRRIMGELVNGSRPHWVNLQGRNRHDLAARVEVCCPSCGRKAWTPWGPADRMADWAQRKLLVQDALPGWSKAEREMLQTGYCTPCWERDFAPELDGLVEAGDDDDVPELRDADVLLALEREREAE